MKKRFLMIFAAILALSGCSSPQTMTSGAPAVGNETEPAVEQVNSVAAITEIALVTAEVPNEPRHEPPQLQVTYSGDGLANCAAMTLGTYTWDDGKIIADSIGPVACAAEGRITAKVDLDVVSENEPKINLWGGAELTGAVLYPLDGETTKTLEFTQDGVISFPADVYDGVVCVSAKFPEGNADYFFMVERSLTNPTQPPEPRVFSGDYIGFKMTRGAYNWTYTEGDEACTVTTDIASPWQMYSMGHAKPELWVLPGETLRIMLPEGGEITSAQCWRSESDTTPLEYSGREIKMPVEQFSAVCSITVKMPAGTCDYLFSVNIGESASSPAYEPEIIAE